MLTDNGSAYRSAEFARASLAAGVRHRRTRPDRPQTNGKAERFNRTLLEEWPHVRVYRSEHARTHALARWLHRYNHHRRHAALGGLPPVSRVTNFPAQYISRTLHDLVETPRIAFGDRAGDRSGIALQTELDPLMRRVASKRLILTAALRRRDRLILAVLGHHTRGVLRRLHHRRHLGPPPAPAGR